MMTGTDGRKNAGAPGHNSLFIPCLSDARARVCVRIEDVSTINIRAAHWRRAERACETNKHIQMHKSRTFLAPAALVESIIESTFMAEQKTAGD
jgi:hypothetical protein